MFDTLAALIGIAVSLPLLCAVGVAVALDAGMPVIFSHVRMGRNGRSFSLFKFRTMHRGNVQERRSFEPGSNRRVTRTGRFLRAAKLDELPQLFNVLKGDMSFVGPRPEVADYRKFYAGRFAKVLGILPGITDEASLRYRHEEKLLADQADPERFYAEVVLPDKLAANLEYVEKGIALRRDLAIILRTIASLQPFAARNHGPEE